MPLLIAPSRIMPLRIVQLLIVLGCLAGMVLAGPSRAFAQDKIALCYGGLVTLPGFEQHIRDLRAARRYEPAEIDSLIARNRKGGPEFFSSQIFIQEEISGSGTFSLRLFHGLLNAKTRNITAWTCERDDYPIVYFVGYRVRAIENGAIEVSREKDVVNVISLKDLDPKLEKRLRVKIYQGDRVICPDLGVACEDRIFYGRE
jgi:hypothetical protein